MTIKINEENQKILKEALRCYREKESSKGNDVRVIKDLLDDILEEIRYVDREEKGVRRVKTVPEPKKKPPNPKKEYMDKISGEES